MADRRVVRGNTYSAVVPTVRLALLPRGHCTYLLFCPSSRAQLAQQKAIEQGMINAERARKARAQAREAAIGERPSVFSRNAHALAGLW